jgi:hypothetical protein
MCTVKYTKYNILTLNTKAWITVDRNRCKTEGIFMSDFRSNGGKQESGTKSFKGEAEIQDFDRVTTKIIENSTRIKI